MLGAKSRVLLVCSWGLASNNGSRKRVTARFERDATVVELSCTSPMIDLHARRAVLRR